MGCSPPLGYLNPVFASSQGGMKAEENDFRAGTWQGWCPALQNELQGQDQDWSLGCPGHLSAGPSKPWVLRTAGMCCRALVVRKKTGVSL